MRENLRGVIPRNSPNRAMRFLKDRSRWLERDLLNIGTGVFNLEAAIKTGKRPDRLIIPLSHESLVRVDAERLKSELEDLILNVLVESVEVVFKPELRGRHRDTGFREPPSASAVCLFSGGVDSYAGILSARREFGDVVGVSVIHGDQPWGSHIVDRVVNRIKLDYQLPFHKLFAPPMMSRGYSQLRGFLYCLYGGIYLSLTKSDTLLITEVGPTMYQPRFSPFDSVTMTTHPFVLKKVKRVLNLVLCRTARLVTPFENMTKSEVVVASELPDGLPLTHSCISLRFGRNEGSCYGCIVRRLGFIVAGREDAPYSTDPLGNQMANADNLASLLRFSFDVLTDYPHMLSSSREIIENYNKRDLFKRFALDTFAALMTYRDEVGKLNPDLKPIFDAGIEHLGEAKLSKRVTKVRRRTFHPNFSKSA
jgi:7-cyano-7-deazaguanine synthase in queuosine biosynthesis